MRRIRITWENTCKGSLILITPNYALSEEGRPKHLTCIGTNVLLEDEAAEMLQKAWAHAGSRDQIVPVSGYRSHEEQIEIWEDTLRKKGESFTRTYVAVPGHSEHESGLAIDLAEKREKIDFIRPEFPREGICGQFRELASYYGFVERYPAGRESITGIGAEPWHFRYVGIPHGTAMKREGMILEEYIAFLKENTSPGHPYLIFEPEERSCTELFYVDMRGKKECFFSDTGRAGIWFSGTNEGGAVICRRRTVYA